MGKNRICSNLIHIESCSWSCSQWSSCKPQCSDHVSRFLTVTEGRSMDPGRFCRLSRSQFNICSPRAERLSRLFPPREPCYDAMGHNCWYYVTIHGSKLAASQLRRMAVESTGLQHWRRRKGSCYSDAQLFRELWSLPGSECEEYWEDCAGSPLWCYFSWSFDKIFQIV